MTTDPQVRARLQRDYGATFARFLFHRDEGALAAAYELGRRSLERRVSLLDIVQIHHAVVIDALPGPEGAEELAEAGSVFLVEVLASFDMAQRAFRDTTD